MHTHRIGILTSGGDCPGLNAVIRGVTKAGERRGWQVIGFLDGFEGLLPPIQYMMLDHTKTSGRMQLGGTILGSTSKGHFVAKVGAGEIARVPAEIIETARRTLADLEIESPDRGRRRRFAHHRAAAPGGRISNYRGTKNHR